jgi:FkbM family methyltransferase
MSKKVFINVGANVGEEALKFDKLNPGCDIYMIEPFQKCIDQLKWYQSVGQLTNATIIEKAAYIKDGNITFYEGKPMKGGSPSESGSICKEKTTNMSGNHYTIECFDFSKWLKQFKDDFVYVHMDIEGGEYEVLPKLFEDGTIDIVNIFGCEFHTGKISDISEDVDKELINKLEEKFGNDFINLKQVKNVEVRKI